MPASSAVRTEGAHHVDGQQPAPAGQRARGGDLAPQRFQVGRVDGRLGRAVGRQPGSALHQVRMVAPQVDRGQRADGTLGGHAAGQPVRRDAHPHAALHDRQQAAAAQAQRRQAAQGRGIERVHRSGNGPKSRLKSGRRTVAEAAVRNLDLLQAGALSQDAAPPSTACIGSMHGRHDGGS
jgi:hypothetical protein